MKTTKMSMIIIMSTIYRSIRRLMESHQKHRKMVENHLRSSMAAKRVAKRINIILTMLLYRQITIINSTLIIIMISNQDRVSLTPMQAKINFLSIPIIPCTINIQLINNFLIFLVKMHQIFHLTFESINFCSIFKDKIKIKDLFYMASNPFKSLMESIIINMEKILITMLIDQVTF